MAEQNFTQQAANSFEKAINDQATRFETAFAELSKLQSKSIAQATSLFEGAVRVAQEQVQFKYGKVRVRFQGGDKATEETWDTKAKRG